MSVTARQAGVLSLAEPGGLCAAAWVAIDARPRGGVFLGWGKVRLAGLAGVGRGLKDEERGPALGLLTVSL
ncbi:hypothetical protein GCM10010256_73090 [Streptomyces coeruleorubidus]|nr:hypothetical protein GCM10010256_73090 [Streptomyces coeruleorubidus]